MAAMNPALPPPRTTMFWMVVGDILGMLAKSLKTGNAQRSTPHAISFHCESGTPPAFHLLPAHDEHRVGVSLPRNVAPSHCRVGFTHSLPPARDENAVGHSVATQPLPNLQTTTRSG